MYLFDSSRLEDVRSQKVRQNTHLNQILKTHNVREILCILNENFGVAWQRASLKSEYFVSNKEKTIVTV